MRAVKVAEILIMILGSAGFYLNSNAILFTALFLMGTHSTFFGPVKYSILPQHLQEKELMAGNALVEMGTFMMILVGTLLGGTLAASGHPGIISATVMGIAIAGYAFSQFIPKAPAADPNLKIGFNFVADMRDLVRVCHQREGILNAVHGISWFWYFGATILAQIPSFAQHTLGSKDPSTTTLLLATFSISVGVGSILCEKLSRGEIELGLVPLGALGMSIFAGDLYFASADHMTRVLFDIAGAGISGSLFIVPLYAYIQHRSESRTRSRLIAANNVFNAVYMVASALFTMIFYKLGLNTAQIILVSAIMNLVVCAWILALIPEFVMRFIFWIIASTTYRFRYKGRDLIPSTGPAIIVANHVSFIDWFVITAACRRPVRFVMDHHFFKTPGIHIMAAAAKAIPIAPAKEDAVLKEKAFQLISDALRDDHVVCIFPEGGITRDGKLMPFKPGIDRILATDPVPVFVLAMSGLWGSFFSRKAGRAMSTVPHPTRREIHVEIRKFEKQKTGDFAPALQNELETMLQG